MKRLLIVIICLVLVLLTQMPVANAADAVKIGAKIVPFNDLFDLFTLIDPKLSIEHGFANDFNDGMAIIYVPNSDPNKSGKCGFINKKGEIIVPPIYDIVRPFNDGLSVIGNIVKSSNGKLTFDGKIIDTNGKVISKTKYAPGDCTFNEGIYRGGIVASDLTSYVNKQGKAIFTSHNIDYRVFPEAYCSEGLIPVCQIVGNDQYWGIVDSSGKWVVQHLEKKIKYRQIGTFSEGLAPFVTLEKEWGYIDGKGNIVAKGFYALGGGLSGFHNGYAIATKILFPIVNGHSRMTELAGVIDKSFKWVIEPKYVTVFQPYKGAVPVAIEDEKMGLAYGLIDLKQNIILPFEYNFIGEFSEGLAAFHKGSKSGYLDEKGNIVMEFNSPGHRDVNGAFVMESDKEAGSIRVYPLSESFYNGMSSISYISDKNTTIEGYLVKRDSHSPIRVKIDGKFINLSADPISEKSTNLVPYKSLFEALGAKANLNTATKTITGTKGDIKIELKIDSKEALLNGEHKTMDAPVKAVNGNYFAPINFIAENMGYKVVWNGTNRIITLTVN